MASDPRIDALALSFFGIFLCLFLFGNVRLVRPSHEHPQRGADRTTAACDLAIKSAAQVPDLSSVGTSKNSSNTRTPSST